MVRRVTRLCLAVVGCVTLSLALNMIGAVLMPIFRPTSRLLSRHLHHDDAAHFSRSRSWRLVVLYSTIHPLSFLPTGKAWFSGVLGICRGSCIHDSFSVNHHGTLVLQL